MPQVTKIRERLGDPAGSAPRGTPSARSRPRPSRRRTRPAPPARTAPTPPGAAVRAVGVPAGDAGEFPFRTISAMIVMPREDEPREVLRSHVVPALAESK